MTDDEFRDAVLNELRALREKLDHVYDYVHRTEVHASGLDTKLRDVLSREAKVSNVARDAYHQWLLSFDTDKREKLLAAASNPDVQKRAEREVTKLLSGETLP